MVTLLLVDDEPTVRSGLKMWFALEPDIQVIGEAGDGAEAVSLAQALRPDVVLLDLQMPRMDGMATATALRRGGSSCAVVILSLHDDPATRARAVAAGADAFVGKHQACDALLPVIRAAARKAQSAPAANELSA